jgi:hypothetical protein
MSQNLITAGFIDPGQLPLDQVRQQVATFLKVSLNQIDRIECWQHQIWVKLVESRAKFISYRSLPLWIEEGIAVIKRCTSRASLDQLGEILRSERDWYDELVAPKPCNPGGTLGRNKLNTCGKKKNALFPFAPSSKPEASGTRLGNKCCTVAEILLD